ncbi:Put_Phosphatase domain-containing protein [Cephalotus follicularis]|uniref:Put_Phosphatase domain-containing protein n=1 Tax=Cephalotus follicularis TaxID=3775 RepID=A0A1Q3CJG7_CEPFO|nr:Put_Phosphatase domain-containing protein [Cephalotus follicularis]
MIIKRIQASISAEPRKKIIYVGDGSNDYCPCLKLAEGDYVMPRKNFPCWSLICENPTLIKADIHGWSDGDEFEHILVRIINTNLMEGNNNSAIALLFSPDYKMPTIFIAAHEAFPRPLPVLQ